MQHLGWQLAVVCGLIALVLGLGMYQHYHPVVHQSFGPDGTPIYEGPEDIVGVDTTIYFDKQTNIPAPGVPNSLVLLYKTQAKSSQDASRSYPTEHIWRKVGNSAPELIATVGQVGEYPANFAVSPKHTYIAVNLEKAVDVINIQTKEKKRIYTTDQWVSGTTFSPDETQLLVSDGSLYYNDGPSTPKLVVISVSDGTISKTIPSTFNEDSGDLSPELWRADDVLFHWNIVPKDCGSAFGYGYYNLSSGLRGRDAADRLSLDGYVGIGDAIETIPFPFQAEMCTPNELATKVAVVEPVVGTILGIVGNSGRPFQFVAFSPDNNEVLFTNPLSMETYEDYYGYQASEEYFRQIIDMNTVPVKVEDPAALLVSWRQPRSLVETGRSSSDTHMMFNGTTILHSGVYPYLIDAYLQ